MKAERGFLISKEFDLMMIGGASALFFVASYWVSHRQSISPSKSLLYTSLAVYYLAFAVNWPHFLISYQLLYIDQRKRLLKDLSYAWAAFIAPALLIVGFACTIFTSNAWALGKFVNLMYLLVGWHYAKQVYGTMIVTSAIRNFYFSPLEKILLRINLHSIWIYAFFAVNQGTLSTSYYGVHYSALGFPAWTRTVALTASLASMAVTLGYVGVRKYLHERRWMPLSALTSYVSLYLWWFPGVSNTLFFYAIPFFHALQYLLFVIPLQKNKIQAQAPATGEETNPWIAPRLLAYVGLSVLLGALAFLWVPNFLDLKFAVSKDRGLGPAVFLFMSNVFLNIHHYFIDNVIWKAKRNPDVNDYLIRPSQILSPSVT